jgi:aryl-alcohol dehydrogenase-like predicted oxidoreductase
VDGLREFARGKGVALPQLAVAWALANPAVNVAIVGARRPPEVEGLLPAAEVTLSSADREQIDRLLSQSARVARSFPRGHLRCRARHRFPRR